MSIAQANSFEVLRRVPESGMASQASGGLCVLFVTGSTSGGDIGDVLSAMGCEVERVCLGDAAGSASRSPLDCILVNVQRLEGAVLATLGELRRLDYYPPLLVVLPGVYDPALCTRALKCGCDAYMPDESDPVLLLAWIEAAARRRSLEKKNGLGQRYLRVGDLTIDTMNRTVRTPFRTAELTEREAQLLNYLSTKPGQICSREEIIQAVWGSSSDDLHGTLNTHVNRIRSKIEIDLKKPVYLQGVYGSGYRLGGGEPAPSKSTLTLRRPIQSL